MKSFWLEAMSGFYISKGLDNVVAPSQGYLANVSVNSPHQIVSLVQPPDCISMFLERKVPVIWQRKYSYDFLIPALFSPESDPIFKFVILTKPNALQ